ncbi:MAG: VacJ family lipoprotein [Arcobacteraceae bacterium]|nr:VacJ family lipoprotein [Arcobacteraceae bacterium]
MIIRAIYFILTISILFTGCTNNSYIDKPSANTEQSITQDDELDEFSDEFEDEDIEEESDPFRGYNVFMTNFNDGFYIHVFDPVAKGYDYVLPEGARKSIKNFFHNLTYPVRMVNNILQGKFENAGEETGRFIVNTTVGILGFFDPAKEHFKLKPHNEDFGQTLGYWGVGSGYHIVLPFFGPSNMRDMLSMYPDSYVNPIVYNNENNSINLTNSTDESLMLTAYQRLNDGSLKLGDYEELKKDAVELYPFLKDIYEQHRAKLIKE